MTRPTNSPTFAHDGSSGFGGGAPQPGRCDGNRRDYTPAAPASIMWRISS